MSARTWPFVVLGLGLGLAQCGREAPPPAAPQPPGATAPATSTPAPPARPALPSLAGLDLRLSVEGGTVAAATGGEPLILIATLCAHGAPSGPAADRLARELQERGALTIASLGDGVASASPVAVESLPPCDRGAAFAIKPERSKSAHDLVLVATCATSGVTLTSNPIQISFALAAWGPENGAPVGLARLVRYRIARGELDEARTALVKLAAMPAQREQSLSLAAALFAADGKTASAQEAERMLVLAVAERAAKHDPPCDHQMELPLLPVSPSTPATPSDPLLSQLSAR